jgi:hypothetical protein
MSYWHCLIAAMLIGSLLVGCQTADEPAASGPLVAAIAETVSADSPSKSDKRMPAASGSDAAGSAAPAVAKFDPPFPNRSDPFAPPRGGQNLVRHDEEHGETIELKGFVDVDGPQVVLAIDGVISPIPEGGERFGVQVISIHPPSVVLQRGRSRWTASLE